MTKYQIPEQIRSKLPHIPKGDIIIERDWITTNDLIYLQQTSFSQIPLSDLTRGLKFYKEPKREPSYSPEFRKQLEILKYKIEEDEYQEMINRDKIKKDDEYVSPSEMAKELKNQMTTILNVFVSVGSVVYAIWYWTNTSGYFALSTRVLLCLFSGILTLVAEVVIYNGFLRRVSEAKDREKNKKEKKKIIETIVFTKELKNE